MSPPPVHSPCFRHILYKLTVRVCGSMLIICPPLKNGQMRLPEMFIYYYLRKFNSPSAEGEIHPV